MTASPRHCRFRGATRAGGLPVVAAVATQLTAAKCAGCARRAQGAWRDKAALDDRRAADVTLQKAWS
jgi:hypothetical protein